MNKSITILCLSTVLSVLMLGCPVADPSANRATDGGVSACERAAERQQELCPDGGPSFDLTDPAFCAELVGGFPEGCDLSPLFDCVAERMSCDRDELSLMLICLTALNPDGAELCFDTFGQDGAAKLLRIH